MTISTIKEKQVFASACRHGHSQFTEAFILHSYPISTSQQNETFQVGYIVTKKIGSAVTRNRIKRRLRMAIAEVFPDYAHHDTYYIFRGRKYCTEIPFIDLKKSIMYALAKSHNNKNR